MLISIICSTRRVSGTFMPIPRIRTCQVSICVSGSACDERLFMECVSFVNQSGGMPLYENTVQYAILKRERERMAKPTFKNADENGLMEA